MGLYLNSGNEGFQNAVNSEIYIDKTGVIGFTNKCLGTEQSCICVSRPRRFGKSMTAAMLAAYYSKGCSSGSLFEGLGISRNKDFTLHLNKYNVIYADMNDFLRFAKKQDDIIKMTDLFQHDIIEELHSAYPVPVAADAYDLPKTLAKIYIDTGEKFIIIIDEWDALFREAKGNLKAQEYYIDFLRGMFKSPVSAGFLKLAYLTGILPIKKYNTQSALNNFKEYTMLEPGMLAGYTGFTREEVQGICSKYNMDFNEMEYWYDGYSFMVMEEKPDKIIIQKEERIYNPNSVIEAVQRRKCGNYWTRTGSFESLKGYISLNFDGLKDSIIQLLSGNRCVVDTFSFLNDMESFSDKDDVLTLLVHLGYLAYSPDKKEVYIPNEEIKTEFQAAIKSTGWDTVVKAVEASDRLLKLTLAGDKSSVASCIGQVHMDNTSILKYNYENSLSCVITLAYYNAMNEYTLKRELPAGLGFADIVFIPKRFSDKPALVIELKADGTAGGAIRQIKEKQYISALGDYKGNLVLAGINYDKKTKKHECKIEKYVYGNDNT